MDCFEHAQSKKTNRLGEHYFGIVLYCSCCIHWSFLAGYGTSIDPPKANVLSAGSPKHAELEICKKEDHVVHSS